MKIFIFLFVVGMMVAVAFPVQALSFPLSSSEATPISDDTADFMYAVQVHNENVGMVGFSFGPQSSNGAPGPVRFTLLDGDTGRVIHQEERLFERSIRPYEEIVFGFPIQPESAGATYHIRLISLTGKLPTPERVRLFADVPSSQALRSIQTIWQTKWNEQRTFWLGYGMTVVITAGAWVYARGKKL